MLLFMFSRRLCEEVSMNLAYRWFCRLGLKDKVPDHPSFSKNRHGRSHDHDACRKQFDSVLRRCMTENLVQGKGFVTDASVIKADAQRHRSCSGNAVIGRGNPEHAVQQIYRTCLIPWGKRGISRCCVRDANFNCSV